ncbi:unnamed protein product [Effrenium voratum]|nr:unnamed protein product [Effrenium voratum]
MFEAMRLSTHVLSSPCTITRSEMTDVGTCTLCDSQTPSTCQVHPITTARLSVNFKHRHLDENITGTVWCAPSLLVWVLLSPWSFRKTKGTNYSTGRVSEFGATRVLPKRGRARA